MFRYSLLTFLVLFLAGCGTASPEHLPAYAWVNGPTAVRTLCERSSAVKTVSAECALTLTRSNGESVRLDGAIAMQLPATVRLRAWKFGQAMFDLTLKPDGLWIQSSQSNGPHDEIMPAGISAAKMARAWSVLSGEFFCGRNLRIYDEDRARFQVERNVDGQRVVCELERATLTPRRYSVMDRNGVEQFHLAIERYEIIQGIAWPVRLVAKSEGGEIAIELKDTELNGELAPNAFAPPRNARRIQ